MNKKKLNDFKNQCAGKTAHVNIISAQYVLDGIRTGVGEILEIYICKFCKKYHIGHKPGTKKEVMKKKIHLKKKIKYKLTE